MWYNSVDKFITVFEKYTNLYFIGGIIVLTTLSGLIYLAICYAVGCYAAEKNRSKWLWFLVSFFISPLFSFIVLLLIGRG